MSRVELEIVSVQKELLHCQNIIALKDKKSDRYLPISISEDQIKDIALVLSLDRIFEPMIVKFDFAPGLTFKYKLKYILLERGTDDIVKAKMALAHHRKILKNECELGQAIIAHLVGSVPVLMERRDFKKSSSIVNPKESEIMELLSQSGGNLPAN